MNTVKRIAKNSAAALLAQISNPISSFIIVLFVARYLGVSGLGILSSALSLLYIFQAFSSIGFSHLITREVAQNKEKAGIYLTNASIVGGVFSIVMTLIMCSIIYLITDIHDIRSSVQILSFALVPSTLNVVFQSICKAYEKIEYITLSQISGNSFKVLVGVILLSKGYGIITMALIITCSIYLMCILNFFLAYSCISTKFFKLEFNFCKYIIKATPVFAFIFMLNTIRWNIDIQILTNMMGETDVGYYSAAFKFMNIVKLGVSSYIFAVQPVVFLLYKNSLEKFKLTCESSIKYLFIITLPCAFGITLLSEQFVMLIFKEDFLPAANVLRIIIWITVFSGANLIFANALIASNNQKINLKGNLIGMISNVLLNFILIPKLSYIGAGIASLLSSFILLMYQYFHVYKELFCLNLMKNFFKPVISAVMMSIFIYVFSGNNLLVVVIISAIIYFIFLLILKTFSLEDRNLFKQLISNN